MKYKVLWRDTRENNFGEPFEVEADSLKKGFVYAVKTIKKGYQARHFVLTDIECLIDERGVSYQPSVFLR